jgi:hypothetical protein
MHICDGPGMLTFGMGIAGLLAIDTAGKASVDPTAGGLGMRLGAAGSRFATTAAVLTPPHALCTGACIHMARVMVCRTPYDI